MKIIKLDIVQFGKFSDLSLSFADGFNIIEGKNESGKSTLQGFIKFILYGLPRRNPNVEIGEHEKAFSWLGGIAKGSLTVEHEGKTYRIEREEKSVGKGSCKIIDLQSGEQAFAHEIPGNVFLGLSAGAYDSMCNIRQLSCTSLDSTSIKTSIENILTGGDETQNAEKALKALDRERTKLMHKSGRGGLVVELREKCDRLEGELIAANSAHEQMLSLSSEVDRKKLMLKKNRDEYDIAQKKCDLYDGVLRLGEFRELSALKKEKEELQQEISALDESMKHGGVIPTQSDLRDSEMLLSSIEKVSEQLKKAQNDQKIAHEDLEKALGDEIPNSESLCELLDEFSSAENLVSHIKKKKKKSASMALVFGAFLALALLLFALGGALMFIDFSRLVFGAVTLLALGAVSLFVGMLALFRRQSASRDLYYVLSKIGKGYTHKDTERIYSIISEFEAKRQAYDDGSNALRHADIVLGMLSENLDGELQKADALISRLELEASDDRAEALQAFAKSARKYFADRAELSGKLETLTRLISTQSARLERYSEQTLTREITPKIEAELKKTTLEHLTLERDAASNKISGLSAYIAERERVLVSLENSARDPEALSRELYSARRERDSEEARLSSLLLAYETLAEASGNLKDQISPRICAETSRLMNDMTNGKYSELYLNDEMSLSVLAEGETRPIEALSSGSCDLAYFSARLSLISVMCHGKNPPLIMDETFAQLDSDRETKALHALRELCLKGQQALLFTCRTVDRTLSSKVFDGNEINIIPLGEPL